MRYTLKAHDWIKGLIMAVLVPVLYIIQNSIAAGSLTFNWKEIGIAALSGLVAYLLKNFFTDDIKQAQKIVDAQNAPPYSAPGDTTVG